MLNKIMEVLEHSVRLARIKTLIDVQSLLERPQELWEDAVNKHMTDKMQCKLKCVSMAVKISGGGKSCMHRVSAIENGIVYYEMFHSECSSIALGEAELYLHILGDFMPIKGDFLCQQ